MVTTFSAPDEGKAETMNLASSEDNVCYQSGDTSQCDTSRLPADYTLRGVIYLVMIVDRRYRVLHVEKTSQTRWSRAHYVRQVSNGRLPPRQMDISTSVAVNDGETRNDWASELP